MSAQIISSLKQLKLHGMAASFPEVCAQARHTEFNPESFMHQLILSESAERSVRSTAYQMGAARFAVHQRCDHDQFGVCRMGAGVWRCQDDDGTAGPIDASLHIVETGYQSWRFKQSNAKSKTAAGVATPAKIGPRSKTSATNKGEMSPKPSTDLNLSTAF